MRATKVNRRHVLGRISAIFGTVLFFRTAEAAERKTPKAIEGPYYPKPRARRADTDNDLVKIDGVVEQAGGEIMMLRGVVTDKSGSPLSGLRVEIWQCDMNGKYLSSRDRRKLKHDVGFQGFGHDITSDKGEYSFRTIKPAKYPSRVEHIHVKVLRGKKEILTTQFYVAGSPDNEKDWIYQRLSSQDAENVLMHFTQETDYPQAIVNIII